MAAQKLFTDFPGKVSGIPGMVTPMMTSDITQKSAEDDPSTLAGYKARLAAQQQMEEQAYQQKLGYQRGLQQQWEQEDLKRQAAEMSNLDRMRKQAFERIYAPTAESQIKLSAQTNPYGGGSTMSTSPLNMQQFVGGRPATYDPGSGALRIPGWGLVGGTHYTSGTGVVMPGVSPTQTQNLTNQTWAGMQNQKAMQNVNPYYRPQ